MRVEGSNGSVEYLDNRIIIRRKGFANVLTQGLQGDKTIPLAYITAVQFRRAGSMIAGVIQFTIQGGREFRGGMLEATKDENAVMFTREQEPGFLRIMEMVELAIQVRAGTEPNVRSAIDDLAKLAELHEKGYLSREEFDDRKRSLFSSPDESATAINHKKASLTKAPELNLSDPLPPENITSYPWWLWALIALGLFLLLSLCGRKTDVALAHGDHWRQVGELGGSPYIRFVEVDTASAQNASVYRDAATKICVAGSDCFQVGFFLSGDQVPPSGDKSSFFTTGGWANYSPAALWSGDDFTKWDCDKAGSEDAPLSALCGPGATEQYAAVLSLASRVGWTIGCRLPATKDRSLVETFAGRQSPAKRDQLMQEFDRMVKQSESGPDDPANCKNLRAHIEEKAKRARKVLEAL